jgi:redox-sensitive bicupin YhaK (pirin superfamily)
VFRIQKKRKMRNSTQLHTAIEAPIDDLITFRALPVSSLDHIDPFLFLNHHGPQIYPPNNNGLPFGPHPHRGFETLTFIFEGDLMHWDSSGNKSIIAAGGVQWMTAGKGLVHAEVSSDDFKRSGGRVEIIQLWFNLPAKLKMVEPVYIGKQKNEIPVVPFDNGQVRIYPVSGKWQGVHGPIESITGIEIASLEFVTGGVFQTLIPVENNILFYVVRGLMEVNGTQAGMHQLVEFDNNSEEIHITALEETLLILGHGTPFHEPIVAQGPFVMNYPAEIRQAWLDYEQGKMGTWESFK